MKMLRVHRISFGTLIQASMLTSLNIFMVSMVQIIIVTSLLYIFIHTHIRFQSLNTFMSLGGLKYGQKI